MNLGGNREIICSFAKPNNSWLGIWFLVQTFEGEIQSEKDAAQDIRAICKLLDDSEESGEEGASC